MSIRKAVAILLGGVLLFGGVLGEAAFVVPALANEGAPLRDRFWSWEGPFGHYDKGQLQRGFQVYAEVCSVCHSLSRVRYRNLLEIGLPEEAVKAYAAEFERQDGFDDQGEPKMRPGVLADRMHKPFPNDQAARAANNGALPPDLSLITKARPNGPNYVYSLLQAFSDPPPEFALVPGMTYNAVFAGNQIAMPAFPSDEQVVYSDGSPNSKEHLVADVVAFLNWAAEPELETRKRLGIRVVLFLIAFSALFFALKKKIWRKVEH